MPTLSDVSTASVLAQGPLDRVRAAVVRAGREAWVAPAADGWVVVLPDDPGPAGVRDDVDPYDLVGLGRMLCDSGVAQVLVLSERNGLALCQLMSATADTAFIGWRTADSGEPPASRVEPDAFTFCDRLGTPARTERLELVLEDVSGSGSERLDALCWALGLPAVAVGATATRLAAEEVHLPGMERQARRRPLERWLGQDFSAQPWSRRTWLLRSLHALLLCAGLAVFIQGALAGHAVHLALAVGTTLALTGLSAEAYGELSRRRMHRRAILRAFPSPR